MLIIKVTIIIILKVTIVILSMLQKIGVYLGVFSKHFFG